MRRKRENDTISHGLGLRVVEHAYPQSLAWWALAGGVIFGVCLHDYTCFSSGSMPKTLQVEGLRAFSAVAGSRTGVN